MLDFLSNIFGSSGGGYTPTPPPAMGTNSVLAGGQTQAPNFLNQLQNTGAGASGDYLGTLMNDAGVQGRSHTQSIGSGSVDDMATAGFDAPAPASNDMLKGILGGLGQLGGGKEKKQAPKANAPAIQMQTARAPETKVPQLVGLTPRAQDVLSRGLR